MANSANSTKHPRKQRKILQIKDGRSETSPLNAQLGGRPKNPDFLSVAIALIEAYYFDKDSETPTLAHWRNQWFSFNGNGWSETAEGQILKTIITHLEIAEEFGPRATKNFILNLLNHMQSFNLCGVSDELEMPLWLDDDKSARNWMGFSNKKAVHVWNHARGKSKRHVKDITPTLFTRDFVSYPFEPTAKCPKFLKYLKRSVPDKDSRELVQQMVGLCVADTCKFEVFFYLYGPTSRNGKTVLLHIMEALVGKRNASHVGLHDLMERFETWPLTESKINIYGDMRTDISRGAFAHVEGVFKDLISGGNVEYQKKGRDKFDAPCRSRFVFAGNSLPTFIDRSDAIWERLRVIHFPVQIPKSERDPNLADRIIKEEMPGVFNWAVKGLSKIINSNRVKESKEGLRVKAEHRLECDREGTFLHEIGYKKGGANDYVIQKKVYEHYRSWMHENGFNPCGSAKFYQRFESLLPGVKRTTKRIPGVTGKSLPLRVYVGVKRG